MKRAEWLTVAGIALTLLLPLTGWLIRIDRAVARIETKLERFDTHEHTIQSVSERLARVEARHPGN